MASDEGDESLEFLGRVEAGEKEARVCLVATEDGSATVAEAMVRPLTPDEALVIQRGLPDDWDVYDEQG